MWWTHTLSARKRLQSVVLRYIMQTSRVNGLTSGVFAFLEPASCLSQKGSDTRGDNTTYPTADDYLCSPVTIMPATRDFLMPVDHRP